jgi:hypothetical protein
MDPVCVKALGLCPGEVTLPKTRAAFARAGLQRGREAWMSLRAGAPSQVMLRSWTSLGLCLSSILNAGLLLPASDDVEGLKALVDLIASEPLPSASPVRFVLAPESTDPTALERAGLKRVSGCTLYAMHRYSLLEYRRFITSRYGFVHGRFRARPHEAA